MDNDRPVQAHLRNLIALCHVLDDFPTFRDDLTALVTSKYNRDDIYNLYRVSQGDKLFKTARLRHFYKKYKAVIDTINEYSCITTFVNFNYDINGNVAPGSCMSFFYDYLSQHRDNLDQIIKVLNRLQELKFYTIKFDENADFSTEEYFIYTDISRNYNIWLFDNMVALPNHRLDTVKYRTTGSPYKINLKASYNEIVNTGYSVLLNSLVFDADRLPKQFTRETFKQIVSLNDTQKENNINVRNSVTLGVAIEDLKTQLTIAQKRMKEIDDIGEKDAVQKEFEAIQQHISELERINLQYNNRISCINPQITKDVLESEKKDYIERRNAEQRNIA